MILLTLIHYEFKKYLTRFNILFLLTLFLLNIGLTVFTFSEYFTGEYKEYRNQKSKLLETAYENPEEFSKLAREHNERVQKYHDEITSSSGRGAIPIFENHYINLGNYNDITLFEDVGSIINKPSDYENRITTVLRDSLFRLEEADEGTYTEQYYSFLCEKYMALADIDIKSEETNGWNEFFSYNLLSVLILISLIGTLCTTFTADDKAQMGNIIHVSKFGDKTTRIAKLIFIILTTGAVVLLFTLVPFVVLAVSSGFSSLGHPVQMIDYFTDCPLRITIGEYLLVYLCLRIILFGVLTLLAAVINHYFNNDKFAFITAAALTVTGLFMAEIPPSSPYYYLQKFSLTEILNVNILFERFRGLNIFSRCVSYSAFVLLTVALVSALLIFAAVKNRVIGSNEYNDTENHSVSHIKSLSLLKAESYKHLVCAKSALMIVLTTMIIFVISCIYYYPTEKHSENQYKDYIRTYAGKITDEKVEMIQNESQYIETSLSEYPFAESSYLSGRITEDEFNGYKKRYNYAEYYKFGCERLCERRDYLVRMSESFPDVEFAYDRGLELYFTSPIKIPVMLLIILIAGSVFSYEYETGMNILIRTTSKGRLTIFKTKLLYSLLLSILLYIIFNITELGVVNYYYDVDFWHIPAQSLPIFETVKGNFTLAEYFVVQRLISLVGYIISCFLVLSFSVITKSQIKAIAVSLLVILIPFVLNEISLVPNPVLNYADMISPMNIELGIASYASCIVLSSALAVTAHYKWCGKRR